MAHTIEKRIVLLMNWGEGTGDSQLSNNAMGDLEFFYISFLPSLTWDDVLALGLMHVVSVLHLYPLCLYSRQKRVEESKDMPAGSLS